MNKRILIIDDDIEIFHAFQAVLSPESIPSRQKMAELLRRPTEGSAPPPATFSLQYASQGEDGFRMVEKSLATDLPFAVAFIDIRMPPGWDGVKTAASIRAIDPNIEIVIVTAYSDRSQENILAAVGTPEKLLFFKKPFDPDEVRQLAISLAGKWNIFMSEREAQSLLKASEEQYRNLVVSISDWVWETDSKGTFTFCSPVCRRLFGYEPEELMGQGYEMLLPDAERDLCHRHFQQSMHSDFHIIPIERVCRRKDGSKIYIESSFTRIQDINGAVTGFRGIDRDITARKTEEERRMRMEEKLRQVQKFEALGCLAGGIAHDFNNVLTPILGCTQICMMKCDKEHPNYHLLQSIEVSAYKATDLVRQILGFARGTQYRFQPLSLNKLVGNFFKMLKRLIPEDIDLSMDLEENLPAVMGDICQVEQILLNLVVNARDAMPARGGKIIIRTFSLDISLEQGVLDTQKRPICGKFVVLAVADNGMGIAEEIVDQIFDTLFTTKEAGKGTGIGLATIAGIIDQLDGHIRIETAVGRGTTFFIYFAQSDQQIPVLETGIRQAEPKKSSGTILVAEDDAAVRATITTSLCRYGFTVLEADSGIEAIKIFEERGKQIELLITDVIMPGCGGMELIEEVRKLRPDLPVIIVSGYPEDILSETIQSASKCIFMAKPCLPSAIVKKVKEMLGRE